MNPLDLEQILSNEPYNLNKIPKNRAFLWISEKFKNEYSLSKNSSFSFNMANIFYYLGVLGNIHEISREEIELKMQNQNDIFLKAHRDREIFGSYYLGSSMGAIEKILDKLGYLWKWMNIGYEDITGIKDEENKEAGFYIICGKELDKAKINGGNMIFKEFSSQEQGEFVNCIKRNNRKEIMENSDYKRFHKEYYHEFIQELHNKKMRKKINCKEFEHLSNNLLKELTTELFDKYKKIEKFEEKQGFDFERILSKTLKTGESGKPKNFENYTAWNFGLVNNLMHMYYLFNIKRGAMSLKEESLNFYKAKKNSKIWPWWEENSKNRGITGYV